MTRDEAIEQALKKDTLVKALAYVCVWECDRAIRVAREQEQYDTTFNYLIAEVLNKYKDYS